jgi:hypothetical protein
MDGNKLDGKKIIAFTVKKIDEIQKENAKPKN